MIPRRPLSNLRGGLALCMIRALKVSGPSSPSVVAKEAGCTMANDQSSTEASTKTHQQGPDSFEGREHMDVLWARHTWKGHGDSAPPPPTPCPIHYTTWLFQSGNCYNKTLWARHLPELCECSHKVPNSEEESREFVAKQTEVPRDI